MTPENVTTSSGHLDWNSPIPYLFGGLGLMLVLVFISLVVLACSTHVFTGSDAAGKPPQPSSAVPVHDDAPKIVVIMPGDDKPTYVATPVGTLAPCRCNPPAASSY